MTETERKMKPSDLVNTIAQESGQPKGTVSAVLDAMKKVVIAEMTAGGEVDFGRDFGKFTTIVTSPRSVYVPSKGESQQTEGRRKVRFRPSAGILKALPIETE